MLQCPRAEVQPETILLQQDQLSERTAAQAAAALELNVHLELQKRAVVSQLELKRTELKFHQLQAANANANAKERLQQFSQMQLAQQAQRHLELKHARCRSGFANPVQLFTPFLYQQHMEKTAL